VVTRSVVSRIISLATIFSPALNAVNARGKPPASLDIVPSGNRSTRLSKSVPSPQWSTSSSRHCGATTSPGKEMALHAEITAALHYEGAAVEDRRSVTVAKGP